MMTFSRRKNTLMMALVYHKMYLVVQLPLMKYFRQKNELLTNGFLRSKISVSDGLVGIIVLPTRLLPTDVGGLLPSALLICDDFLCCCIKLWLSRIANFFCSGLLKESLSIFFIPNQQLCFVLSLLSYLFE